MSSKLTLREVGKFFDSLPEDQRDGMTKEEFMREVRRVLDPKRNASILEGMVESRSRIRLARENKARIDRARRNSAIGLR